MRHKRRHGVNPLREYRRLQREIRALFDPFTARHCPGCAAPCCIQPTRVTPVDVALALGVGHAFPHLQERDAYAPALEYAGHRLAPIPLPMAAGAEAPVEYCEYLHRGRCTFPDDLRPFGCTQYVCGPMYAHLPDETLRRLRPPAAPVGVRPHRPPPRPARLGPPARDGGRITAYQNPPRRHVHLS